MSGVWKHLVESQRTEQSNKDRDQERFKAIYASLIPKGKQVWDDPSPFKSICAPRRSSKSYTGTAVALMQGESKPGSRVLVIGLSLKSCKENFWSTAPGGIQAFDARFGLGLNISYQDIAWRHQNNSIGFLAGAGTADDLEKLRGSKVEADLIVVDECKSFSPDRLKELITDILMPGLMTRGGKLLLTGTPGSVCTGVFYEATSSNSYFDFGGKRVPTCIPYELRTDVLYQGLSTTAESEDSDIRWSSHSWGIKDNTSNPRQWQRALVIKRMNGWGDDHPTWRREFLGEWVEDDSEMVYAYLKYLNTKKVSWEPTIGKQEGPGWSYLVGIDLGFEDDTALSVACYNETDGILRHIETYKQPHLNTEEALELTKSYYTQYNPEIIVMDVGGGAGKMILETFAAHGLPVVAADKVNKNDFIELLNGDFHAERVWIARNSELHHEMTSLTWDLSKGDKKFLARTNRLKENREQPNHACDSFLYLWRWAQARFWNRKDTTAPKEQTDQDRINREVREYLSNNKPDNNIFKVGRTSHSITRRDVLLRWGK